LKRRPDNDCSDVQLAPMADADISDTFSHACTGTSRDGDARSLAHPSEKDATLSIHTTGKIPWFSSAGWVTPLCGGAIAFITSIAAQWLIYDYWLRGSGLRLADPIVAAIAVALFVRHLRQTALRNRLADLRRFTVIREMNHHIRNALQVLAYQPLLPDPSSEMARQAIKRIEWVLTEVLPAVRDEGIDGEK
jgi:hypothetical protein